jgi:DNA-binding response OmpR family regulator
MALILIVEDEAAISDLVAIHAKMAGHRSAVIRDGGEVMGFLEKTRPDLIVLDVMLPGRDGFALMEAIAPMGIPVIFLTARDRLDDKIAGLKLGADDYIVKPFAVVELMTRMETVLRRYNRDAAVFVSGGLTVRLAEHENPGQRRDRLFALRPRRGAGSQPDPPHGRRPAGGLQL